MENFDGLLNGETQNEGTVGKAIVFAFLGMLVGIIPSLVIIGLLDMRGWWIVAASVGGAISLAWHLGKGRSGAIRQITIILFSIIGTFVAIQLGYAIAISRIGLGIEVMEALEEWTIGLFLDGLAVMFDNFSSIFSSGDLASMIAWDTVLGSIVAIAVAWRKFNPNSGSEDLEELDNDIDGLSAKNTID